MLCMRCVHACLIHTVFLLSKPINVCFAASGPIMPCLVLLPIHFSWLILCYISLPVPMKYLHTDIYPLPLYIAYYIIVV